MTEFASLPEDIILDVLVYLDQEMMNNLSLTCKDLYRIIKSNEDAIRNRWFERRTLSFNILDEDDLYKHNFISDLRLTKGVIDKHLFGDTFTLVITGDTSHM